MSTARKPSFGKPGAFTLIEALIMALFLSGGVSWLLQSNVMGLRLVSQAYTESLVAKGVMAYYLEHLRSLPFDALPGNVSAAPFDTPVLSAGRIPDGQARLWVEDASGGANTLKKVTAQVQWTDANNRSRSSTATTLIGRQGLMDNE